MKAAIYDNTSGMILRTVEAPENMLALQVGSNEALFIGEVDIESNYIDIVTGFLATKPLKQTELDTFDWVTKQWVTPNTYLQSIKDKQISNVNSLTGIHILAKYPQWKQANLQAQWSALVYADAQLGPGILTNQQSEIGTYIQSVWDWVATVRAASNVATASITDAASAEGVAAIVSNYETQLQTL